MSSFLDGPAAGVTLDLRHAPILLRVVQSPSGFDALDQIEDEPKHDEVVHVYIMSGHPIRFHLNSSVRGASGFRTRADYRYLKEQPDREHVYDTKDWADWCEANRERLFTLYQQSLPEVAPESEKMNP